MATIKFERDSNGNLVAVDAETGKKIGTMSTMGDEIKEETPKDKK